MGHTDNILDKWHNKVNIGITYDDYFLALVQHFANDYIDWQTLYVDNSRIILNGMLSGSISNNIELYTIAIYHDPLPRKMSTDELNNTPNCYTYGGGVTCSIFSITPHIICPPPPPGYFYIFGCEHIADKWLVNGNNFYIESPITFRNDGAYTFLLYGKV